MTPSGDGSEPIIGSDGMLDRLRVATKGETYAQIGRVTGCNSETVRRYLNGGTPSVEFIAAVAAQYQVSADWLLLGRGPRLPAVGAAGHNGPPSGSPQSVEVRRSTDESLRTG